MRKKRKFIRNDQYNKDDNICLNERNEILLLIMILLMLQNDVTKIELLENQEFAAPFPTETSLPYKLLFFLYLNCFLMGKKFSDHDQTEEASNEFVSSLNEEVFRKEIDDLLPR